MFPLSPLSFYFLSFLPLFHSCLAIFYWFCTILLAHFCVEQSTFGRSLDKPWCFLKFCFLAPPEHLLTWMFLGFFWFQNHCILHVFLDTELYIFVSVMCKRSQLNLINYALGKLQCNTLMTRYCAINSPTHTCTHRTYFRKFHTSIIMHAIKNVETNNKYTLKSPLMSMTNHVGGWGRHHMARATQDASTLTCNSQCVCATTEIWPPI